MTAGMATGRTFGSPWGIRRRLLCLAMLAVLSAAGALAPRATAAGSMIDLGSLVPGCGSSAAAINDVGQVAGASCGEPFRWTRVTGMRDLGALSSLGEGGSGAAINILGQVTGWSAGPPTPTPGAHAFLSTASGGLQDLDAGSRFFNAWAQAINDKGEVAGTWIDQDQDANWQVFTWSRSHGIQNLGSLGGQIAYVGIGPPGFNWSPVSCCTSPDALNNHGDITGVSLLAQTPEDTWHAFLYTPSGGMQDLGTLPGDTASAGVAVNDLGEVAGNSQTASGVSHAFLWTRSRGMRKLALRGGTSSDAVGINDLGEVVGYSQLADGSVDAFLWTPRRGMRDLGPGQAVAINELGQVAVNGPDGAYLWTPSRGMRYIGRVSATALNDRGQVTGQMGQAPSDAFLWTP
jgi:probable HAF family extracellular repeat protein